MPRDVVPIVMDYAELWHHFPLVRTNRFVEINHRVGRQIYLMATIPGSVPPGAVRSLTVKILSSDLNKGLRTFNHGGQNPFSFFQLSLITAARMAVGLDCDVDNWIRDDSSLMILNHHHSQDYTMYSKWCSVHDPDRESRALVRSIGPGDKLALIMRVTKAAYVSSARFASIECQVALVRKM
ncbi:hypothetical protein B0A52_04910 [Exophiala mesophila]|uniref:Uncharacterized protein n=1 Tax=Exophiala mesophila TaxID=212818 RepID=A0A438N6D3_EXOME|nr:hypothetical protein B0A52_04910 [Exophiala mesophila]